MAGKRKLIRGAAVLAAGNAGSQVLSLLRNLIVARLMAPEDFGIAVTFALTLSVLEAAFAHGFDKLLVQDEDGTEESLQSMLQSVLLARGVVLALAIFVAAPWIAHFFGIPDATLAYQMLALVPLIRGFAHLDVKRVQRDMDFSSDLIVRLTAQVIGIVVAAVCAFVFRDYWAMLWAVLAQVLCETLLSHMMATRRFRLGWDSHYADRIIGFTVPLMVNGIVMLLAGQGTQIAIGGLLSVTDLALFSASAMLASAGLMFLARVTGDLSLPWLSTAKNDQALYRRRHRLIGTFIAAMTLAVFAPLSLIGTEITTLLFGQDYRAPVLMMSWLALGTGLRYLRTWPIITAMSFGDTKNLMLGNVMRAFALVFVLIFLHLGYGVVGAAAGLAIAEGLATLVSFWRLRLLPSAFMTPWRSLFSAVSIGMAVSFAGGMMIESLAIKVGLACVAIVLPVLASVLVEPEFRRMLGSIPGMRSSGSGDPR
jgi:O-antigen/teichoic acid export membrane protein